MLGHGRGDFLAAVAEVAAPKARGTVDGRRILDGTAGLWCCNLGHGREEIATAVAEQIGQMEYAPTFQMGHPLPFS
ncbi:MAG: hypothetical protein AAGD86_00320, partial [Pseudomonadota bacterium]